MAEQQLVSMNIDPEMVESIIKKNIQTSLLAAMGDDQQKSAVLDAIVMSALKTKVNSGGKISNYSSDNKYEYLDWKVQTMIRTAAKDALNEYVDSRSNSIKKAIKKSIESNSSKIADSLVKSFVEKADSNWQYKVNLTVNDPSDR